MSTSFDAKELNEALDKFYLDVTSAKMLGSPSANTPEADEALKNYIETVKKVAEATENGTVTKEQLEALKEQEKKLQETNGDLKPGQVGYIDYEMLKSDALKDQMAKLETDAKAVVASKEAEAPAQTAPATPEPTTPTAPATPEPAPTTPDAPSATAKEEKLENVKDVQEALKDLGASFRVFGLDGLARGDGQGETGAYVKLMTQKLVDAGLLEADKTTGDDGKIDQAFKDALTKAMADEELRKKITITEKEASDTDVAIIDERIKRRKDAGLPTDDIEVMKKEIDADAKRIGSSSKPDTPAQDNTNEASVDEKKYKDNLATIVNDKDSIIAKRLHLEAEGGMISPEFAAETKKAVEAYLKDPNTENKKALIDTLVAHGEDKEEVTKFLNEAEEKAKKTATSKEQTAEADKGTTPTSSTAADVQTTTLADTSTTTISGKSAAMITALSQADDALKNTTFAADAADNLSKGVAAIRANDTTSIETATRNMSSRLYAAAAADNSVDSGDKTFKDAQVALQNAAVELNVDTSGMNFKLADLNLPKAKRITSVEL